ncbi:MAG: TraR/DksA C4-type zinc finger protein [Propionibacteriaceae bacterium]
MRGTVEKTYTLRMLAAQIRPDDVETMSIEDHTRAFMAYAAGLLGDFDRYLSHDPAPGRDGADYRVNAMWLADAEYADSRVARHPHTGAVEDDLAIFAGLLAERATQARTQQAALRTAIVDMRTARSLTVADDEHDPEGSTVSLDQARDAALLERTERTLAEILAAQQRLAVGTYGVCDRCGRDVPTERLQARPEARRCVRCAAS